SEKEEVREFPAFAGEHSTPEVIVHNGGALTPGPMHSEPEGNFEHMMHTNLHSAYYLTREFSEAFIQRKSGHIFTIGSIAALGAYPNGGSYAISKWALRGFTQCLRQEMTEYGVKVTSILAGATWTGRWKGIELPEERLMKEEDIADAVGAAHALSQNAVAEEIVVRPQLGDI